MSRNIFLLLIFFCFANLKAQQVVLKSVQAYSGAQEDLPILELNDNLTIEFDVQAEYQPNLSIVFRLCDKDWNVYEDPFLNNDVRNIENNLWFDMLPAIVKEARYHYKGSFPNKNVDFHRPGFWKYFITSSQNYNEIYSSGRFIVVKDYLPILTEFIERKLNLNIDNNVYERRLELKIDFTLPDSLNEIFLTGVDIIENHKLNAPIRLDKKIENYKYYSWNGANRFTFGIENLFLGNNYRQTDIRDSKRYIYPETTAQLDAFETSNFYYLQDNDLNGGSILMDWRDSEARYLWVAFSLRAPVLFSKSDIYLTGAFTNWEILPEFKMFNSNGLFTIEALLKRGIYDYEYVIYDPEAQEGNRVDWISLAGNEWETENEYHIFVLYHDNTDYPYDKVIGYKKSRNK